MRRGLIKGKGRSLIHAGIAVGAGCFKLKSVEREKVNMYGRGGECDKNKQGASWETVTEMEGGRTRKKDPERDWKQNSLLSCNQSPFGGSVTGS